jgi:hypothetical protein
MRAGRWLTHGAMPAARDMREFADLDLIDRFAASIT